MAKKATKAELEQSVKVLREEIDTVKEEMKIYLKVNSGLRGDIEKWRQNRLNANDAYHQLETKASEVVQQNTQLTQTNKELKEVVGQWKREYDDITSERNKLGEEVSRLKRERDLARNMCIAIKEVIQAFSDEW